MVEIIDRRITAKIDGDFVVFLIGMRINKPWKVWKWLPVALAMPKMLKELEAKPAAETGFLGHTGIGKVIVQYWRSFDHLEAYAKARELRALAGLGRFQPAHEGHTRRRRHLARDLSRARR